VRASIGIIEALVVTALKCISKSCNGLQY